MPSTAPVKRVEVWDSADGWRWHALSTNGRILSDSGQGYARRNTALRYMEAVTDARQRRIPVFVRAKRSDEWEKLY